MEPFTDRVGWYLFYLYLSNICETICQKVPRMKPFTDRVGWYLFYLYLLNIFEIICQKVPRIESIIDRVGWYLFYFYLFNICESICQKVPRMEPITDTAGLSLATATQLDWLCYMWLGEQKWKKLHLNNIKTITSEQHKTIKHLNNINNNNIKTT